MENDDIPELEDFSNELNKIKLAKGTNQSISIPIKVEVKDSDIKQNSTSTKIPIKVIDNSSSSSQITNTKTENNKSYEFGSGLKKGFFSNKTNSVKEQKNEIKDLTNIKAKKNILEIDEVQENMKNQSQTNDSKFLINNIMGKKDQWMNQDLFTKLAKNPKLLQAFTHPSFSEVMKLLQENPAEAKKKYGNSPEFNEFFKEFSGLMAEHFKSLSDKDNNEFLESKKQDPEVAKILEDSKVLKVLDKLAKEGKLEPESLGNDIDLIKKIQLLIEKGVLKSQNV